MLSHISYDDLIVITPLFNPTNCPLLAKNYRLFADGLESVGVKLLTVELTIGDQRRISSQNNSIWLSGTDKAILWQKERLLNVGIERSSNQYTYIALCDSDVLFEQDSFYRIIETLEQYDIVQGFTDIVYLPNNVTSINDSKQPVDRLESAMSRHIRGMPFLGRAPGLLWAARSSLLKQIKLYDHHVIGGGDTFLLRSLIGTKIKCPTEQLTNHMMTWINMIRDLKLRVGVANNRVYHLWHGDMIHRQYITRNQILADGQYDPGADIHEVDGVYEWSSDKPGLHQAVFQYFMNRSEHNVAVINGNGSIKINDIISNGV